MPRELTPDTLHDLARWVRTHNFWLPSINPDTLDAHADEWQARERRIALLEGDLRTAKANWDAACDDAAKLEADNAALRERLASAKRILISEGWDAHKLDDALASQPEVKP